MDLLVSAALATLIGAVCLAITTGDVLPRPPPVSVTRPAGIATTITARTPSPPARGGLTLALTWPLSPRPTVGRRFEQPHTQCSSGHRGVDLSASVSQAVLSAGEGRRGILRHGRGGGDHCSASERTAHQLRTGRVRMSAGARVRRGTRIAVVSATAGHCAPLTCLHWGAISGKTCLDPLALLGIGRPILLPLG